MKNALETLNFVCKGWTQSPSGDLLCNPCLAGGIIDKTIKGGEWFVIFNDERATIEGLESQADAVEAFCAASVK